MSTTTLYRVTKATPNPDYDGRRRYGLDALKTFEVGEAVSVLESNTGMSLSVLGRNRGHLSQGVWAALRENLTPVDPQTWAEIYAAWGEIVFPDEVIDALLRDGTITLGDLRAAWDARVTELEAEGKL